MVRFLFVAVCLLLSGLFALPVFAEAQNDRRNVQLTSVPGSKVSQTQKKTVQKRALLKQQRDKKLKTRSVNAEAKGGPTSLQKPPQNQRTK